MFSKKTFTGLIVGLLLGAASSLTYLHQEKAHLDEAVRTAEPPSLMGQLNATLKEAEKYRFDESNLLDSIETTLNADDMYITDWKNRREIPAYWGYQSQLAHLRRWEHPEYAAIDKGDFRLIRIDGIYVGVDCMGEVPSVNISPLKWKGAGDMMRVSGRGALGRSMIHTLIGFAENYNTKIIQQSAYPYQHVCRWVPRELTQGSEMLMLLSTPHFRWAMHTSHTPSPETEQRQHENETASLHTAAYFGQLEAMQQFLASGAKPDEWDEFGNLPLHYAVWGRQPDAVRMLLEHGADPMKPGKFDDRLKYRLHMRIDPMFDDPLNFPFTAERHETAPIFHAMNLSEDEIVSDMIAHGKNLRGIDLMIRKGWDRYIPDMVAHGADPNLILQTRRKDSVPVIEERGGDPMRFLLDYDENALALALRNQNKAQVKMLLDAGARPAGGRSYVPLALQWGDMEVIEMLKGHGMSFADGAAASIPRLYAEGRDDLVAYLEAAGVPRNTQSELEAWGELFKTSSGSQAYGKEVKKLKAILAHAPIEAFASDTNRAVLDAAIQTNDRQVIVRARKCNNISFLGENERASFIEAVRNLDLVAIEAFCKKGDAVSRKLYDVSREDRARDLDMAIIDTADMSAKYFIPQAMKAIAKGDVERLKKMIANGLNPLMRSRVPVTWWSLLKDTRGSGPTQNMAANTLLDAAILADRPEIVSFLIAHDSAFYQENPDVLSKALRFSMNAQHKAAFKALIEHGAVVQGSQPWGFNDYQKSLYRDFRSIYEDYHKDESSPAAPD